MNIPTEGLIMIGTLLVFGFGYGAGYLSALQNAPRDLKAAWERLERKKTETAEDHRQLLREVKSRIDYRAGQLVVGKAGSTPEEIAETSAALDRLRDERDRILAHLERTHRKESNP